jgi:hypothetical protein
MMQNHGTAPQFKDRRTHRTLENTRTHFVKLLVAEHVTIYRPGLQNMQFVPSDKGPEVKTIQRIHPLPIPEARWDVVSIDFIVELPDSHGFDATMVVVDSVSK